MGRRTERAALEQAFQRARLGRRTVVSIRGEAGIGKSALLSEVQELARANGSVVVSTAVTAAESVIGWGGLATLLHGLPPELIESRRSSHVEALRSVMGAGDVAALDPLNAAAALTDVLRQLADARPAVVAIDDLHWLDLASAAALSFALRLLADAPLLFVVASRPVRLPIELGRVVDADSLVVVEPAPLSVAGVRELLIDRYGIQLGRVDLVGLHSASGGNPLHVIETGRLLSAGTPLADALLPASLRDIIDVDLGRVGAADLPVLGAAALMPQARLSVLHQLFSSDEVDSAISAAEGIDLVRTADDTVLFRHPLLIAGLVDRLSTSERRDIHRRCAELATNDEVRAFHVSEAASGVDSAAAELLDRAANAATDRGLFAHALVHAQRALALTDPVDRGAAFRRTVRVADLAIDSGEPQRALDLITPVLDELDEADPRWADITELAAVATAAVLGSVVALPMLERLAELRPVGSVERANAIGQVAAALMFTDIRRASQVCADAEVAAVEAGDHHLAQVVGAARALADTVAGLPTELPTQDPSEAVSLSVLCDWLTLAVWTDDHQRAEVLYQASLEQLALRPTVTLEHNVLNQATDLRARQGRLAEAAVLAERALTFSDAIDHDGPRSCDVAVLAAMRGDFVTSRRHAAFAMSVGAATSALLAGQTHFTFGFVEALGGNLRVAADHLRRATELWDSVGALGLGALPIRSELAEVLLQAGELDEAAVLVDRMAGLAAAAGGARADAEVAYVRSQLHAARGHFDEAAREVEIAIDAYEQLDLPVYRARALLVAGNIARRSRRRTAARELLERALAGFTACGADGFVPRVQAELSRLGERVAPDQLTATESQIATLVAAGLSNDEVATQLVISRRTVESNLTRIYRKVNVRGRAELAARFAARST